MNQLKTQLKRYLQETLQLEPRFRVHDPVESWPLMFRSVYEVAELELLGQSFLLVTAKDPAISPASLEKQLAWMRKQSGKECIYLTDALSAYARKRLMEGHIPFVVPGNQLFLPDLGLDLREHLRKTRETPEAFSPSSQFFLLWHCLKTPQNTEEAYTASALAHRFGYSKMTMGRALDELEALNLITREQQGRQKQARFCFQGRDLWTRSRPYLQNPVQRRLYFAGKLPDFGLLAGESALAASSMLADPPRQVRALAASDWKQVQPQVDLQAIPEQDRAAADLELELWCYDPKPLSKGDQVDPLSLILSFSEESDERIEGELRDLEEGLPWS